MLQSLLARSECQLLAMMLVQLVETFQWSDTGESQQARQAAQQAADNAVCKKAVEHVFQL